MHNATELNTTYAYTKLITSWCATKNNWSKNFDSVQIEKMRLYGRPTLEFEVLEIKRFFLQMSQKIEVLYQTTPKNETHTHTQTHTRTQTHTH